MFNQDKSYKEAKKDALKEYNRRQKVEAMHASDKKIEADRKKISVKIDQLQSSRNELVIEVAELRKTDPEAAAILITRGAAIDEAIRQARNVSLNASTSAIQSQVNDLIDESIALMRDLHTKPIKITSQKELEKIKKNKKINDILQEMANSSRQYELELYTDGISAADGSGSAFENDVLAYERKAAIDEIDE